MPKVTFLPSGQQVEIDTTTTLREASYLVNVDVHDRCGGLGACCNCVVTVVSGAEHIGPKTVVEEAVFYLAADDRLSCQCRITGDVVVKTSHA
ncbi:MAG: 2Fe-2S iron-sulfur cluster-binding protein [Candidatus Melainabacteria bacterium]|nr:2Fe-2S iron-sulfur cluster-binding protein [Candidatus Melainabacteria bacterium]